MPTPHYLRFVQALLLAAAVPACASETPAPQPEDTTKTAETADEPEAEPAAEAEPAPQPAPVAENEPTPEPADDAGADAGLPFYSGPIVPPELPASFA